MNTRIARPAPQLAAAFVALLALPLLGAAPPSKGLEVHATNDAFLDMHVYVVQSGQYRSLGTVTGLSNAKLTIPQAVVNARLPFQILVDPVGAPGRYLTDELIVSSGEHVVLEIKNRLYASTTRIEKSG